MFRYRVVLTIFLIGLGLYSGVLSAQNISVKSFRLLETDLTANTAGTMKRDQNNEVSALIKVVSIDVAAALTLDRDRFRFRRRYAGYRGYGAADG